MQKSFPGIKVWRRLKATALSPLGFLTLALAVTGFQATPSQPFQINRPELSAETEVVEQPIELEIPEALTKIWEKAIPNRSGPALGFIERLEPWLLGGAIDLRPPEMLLQFQEDLEFLADDGLPGAPVHADFLYIGFPASEGAKSAPEVWSAVIEGLGQVGLHPAFPLLGTGWGFITTWKHWEAPQSQLESHARYGVQLVHLENRGRLYLKLSLLDGYAFEPIVAEAVEADGHASLSVMSRRRLLRKLANQLFVAIEKARRRQRRQEWIQRFPTILLRQPLEQKGETVEQKLEMAQRKLLIEAPFALVWETLPFCLEPFYIKITERNLPKAEMTFEISPPPAALQKLLDSEDGFQPSARPEEPQILDWLPGQYKLQLFDRGEATELTVCDTEEDYPLPEANDLLFEALAPRLAHYQEVIARSKFSDESSALSEVAPPSKASVEAPTTT